MLRISMMDMSGCYSGPTTNINPLLLLPVLPLVLGKVLPHQVYLYWSFPHFRSVYPDTLVGSCFDLNLFVTGFIKFLAKVLRYVPCNVSAA